MQHPADRTFRTSYFAEIFLAKNQEEDQQKDGDESVCNRFPDGGVQAVSSPF